MSYTVKEIFPTLQGEGAQAGRTAVFCRFAGCNLWSGLERDRDKATCRFCDTDFIGTDGMGGGRFATAAQLADAIAATWPGQDDEPGFVVFTGGEPLLQLDAPLITALHALNLEIAVETNGTLPAPAGIDWLCVSPKAGAALVLKSGDELKLVYPQPGLPPDRVADLDFRQFWLQPMDNAHRDLNTAAAVDYCMHHPQWRLSLQTHKLIGIP
ncbi:7-carboxy-7-deazaguanine synthase [Komagataeibacter sp. FNDCR2]|uniref:7-carboxy-7-deazaguanine synthase n=1 Tax=Komagataeibacter sp. FNDCR2 TaxID=2878682 RepID=UPI001E4478B5|nr:7-carboxy-7-deazaguanine synthase [Komagataeibacter sp. FNDCR2]MCE2573960.1 7-carboxy-7-deazaguanine synthase [Komagataeibacter sp. FNDCR2]